MLEGYSGRFEIQAVISARYSRSPRKNWNSNGETEGSRCSFGRLGKTQRPYGLAFSQQMPNSKSADHSSIRAKPLLRVEERIAMDGPRVECRKHINADLPALLAELNELSVRTKPSSDSQRNRSKEIGQPSIVIRSK